jgi:hypothetical protein
VTPVEDLGNAYEILINPGRKALIVRPKHGWKNIIWNVILK